MRKLLGFVLFGASLAAITAACVDDDAALSTNTTGQGQEGGPCFANNTCNPGLECAVISGSAKCRKTDGGSSGTTTSSSGSTSGSTSSSGSLIDADAPTDSGTDSGPTACSFTATKFPCGGDNPPTACYGATQSCTITGCGGVDDIRWTCNSPKECGGIACCLAKTAGTAKPDTKCANGSLQMTAGTTTGSVCGVEAKCGETELQLCATSADCPSPEQCKPVIVTGAGASFNGQTLGVCTP